MEVTLEISIDMGNERWTIPGEKAKKHCFDRIHCETEGKFDYMKNFRDLECSASKIL